MFGLDVLCAKAGRGCGKQFVCSVCSTHCVHISQSLLALHAGEEECYSSKELKLKPTQNDQEMESQSLLALHAAEEASYRTNELEPESNKNDQEIESQSQSLLALHKQEDYKKEELDGQSKRKMMIDGKFSWSLSLELDNV